MKAQVLKTVVMPRERLCKALLELIRNRETYRKVEGMNETIYTPKTFEAMIDEAALFDTDAEALEQLKKLVPFVKQYDLILIR